MMRARLALRSLFTATGVGSGMQHLTTLRLMLLSMLVAVALLVGMFGAPVWPVLIGCAWGTAGLLLAQHRRRGPTVVVATRR